MDNKFIILYSKYSNISKKYIENAIEKIKEVELNILCIDNKNVRNKIENVLGVAELPCVLVYTQDQIETYSGKDSYSWLAEMIRIVNLKNNDKSDSNAKNKTILYEKKDEENTTDSEDDDKEGILSTMSDRNTHFGKNRPLSIRKNAGNYDYDITNLDDKKYPNSDENKTESIVTNGIKKNNANGKKQNIVAMATAMQKSREEFDNYNKKKI